MSANKETLNKLNTGIPRSEVSTRSGGGGKALSYLQGYVVIDLLNEIFGADKWASKTEKMELLDKAEVTDQYGKKKYCVGYMASVRLVVTFPDGTSTEHTCHGFGNGQDKDSFVNAHELALKEAETDALKRAAKNFGKRLGLALYNKDQDDVVEEDAPAGKPQAVVSAKPASATPSPQTATGTRPKLSESTEPKRAAAPEPDRPKQEAPQRDNLNRRISTLSKILNSTGKASFAVQKERMKNTYGADNKDQLTDAQAAELVSAMEQLAQAAS